MLFKRVICCSGGSYAVQEGYMDVQEGYINQSIKSLLQTSLYRASLGKVFK